MQRDGLGKYRPGTRQNDGAVEEKAEGARDDRRGVLQRLRIPLAILTDEASKIYFELSFRAEDPQQARRSAFLGTCIGNVRVCTNEA